MRADIGSSWPVLALGIAIGMLLAVIIYATVLLVGKGLNDFYDSLPKYSKVRYTEHVTPTGVLNIDNPGESFITPVRHCWLWIDGESQEIGCAPDDN